MTGDVASRDPDAIENRIDRFRAVDENLGRRSASCENRLEAFIEQELRKQTITLFWLQVTVVMTMAALAFGLVRFT